MNKRTLLLKNLATHQPLNIITQDLPKDVLADIEQQDLGHATQAIDIVSGQQVPLNHWETALKFQLGQAVKILHVQSQDLQRWLDLYPQVPELTKLSLLRMITRSNLDPFLGELVFTKYEDDHWEAIITVNGWSTLMNRCSAFSGVQFSQSLEEVENIPLWMECMIYRSDRSIPITTREYFVEVKGETELWRKMPRRMLRHRVFVQCARIALGI